MTPTQDLTGSLVRAHEAAACPACGDRDASGTPYCAECGNAVRIALDPGQFEDALRRFTGHLAQGRLLLGDNHALEEAFGHPDLTQFVEQAAVRLVLARLVQVLLPTLEQALLRRARGNFSGKGGYAEAAGHARATLKILSATLASAARTPLADPLHGTLAEYAGLYRERAALLAQVAETERQAQKRLKKKKLEGAKRRTADALKLELVDLEDELREVHARVTEIAGAWARGQETLKHQFAALQDALLELGENAGSAPVLLREALEYRAIAHVTRAALDYLAQFRTLNETEKERS